MNPSQRMKGDDTKQEADEEGYRGITDSFLDNAVLLRLGKVYFILCVQLAFTMAFIAFFPIPSLPVRVFAIAAVAAALNRKSPFLAFLTLWEVCQLEVICSTYDVVEMRIAMGVTAGVVLALTVFARRTKMDFTAWADALRCVLAVFVLVGLVAAFFPHHHPSSWSRTVRLFNAGIGAIIYSLFIVVDTQTTFEGKHKYSLDSEDQVFAIINLTLFGSLLEIIRAAMD